MGVMACSRNGCDNILCDHYSGTFGYICRECKNELTETRGSTTIGEFMKTPKHDEYQWSDKYAWGNYVDNTFRGIDN